MKHDKLKFVGQSIGGLAATDAWGPASEGESAGGLPKNSKDEGGRMKDEMAAEEMLRNK